MITLLCCKYLLQSCVFVLLTCKCGYITIFAFRKEMKGVKSAWSAVFCERCIVAAPNICVAIAHMNVLCNTLRSESTLLTSSGAKRERSERVVASDL